MADKHLLGNNQLKSSYPTESNSDKKPKSSSVMGHTMAHQNGSSSKSSKKDATEHLRKTSPVSSSPAPSNNANDKHPHGNNQLKSSNPTESNSDKKPKSSSVMGHKMAHQNGSNSNSHEKSAAELIRKTSQASSSSAPSNNAKDNVEKVFGGSTNKKKK